MRALFPLNRIAARRWSIFLPGSMAVAVRLVLLPWVHIPYPATHDEFSYLLGADTLSRGRLTNPTHPLWKFFETIHVISIPTYASKYPPGQAFFLAIGERLFGHPFFGSVLACFVFVAAVVWMLRAWMSSEMALLGGLIVAVAFGSGNYWLDSYWGGFVGCTGAALVVGSLGRMRNEKRLCTPWHLAAGAILLWFTRPFEGAFLVLAAGLLLLFDVVHGKIKEKIRWDAGHIRSFIAVLLGCAVATLGFQAYYDHRVTGQYSLLPYQLHQKQYNYEPVLWFQHPQVPTLDANPIVQKYHKDWEFNEYLERRDLMLGRLRGSRLQRLITPPEPKELLKAVQLIVAVVVICILSILFWADREVKALWSLLAISSVPILLETFTFAHYMVGVTSVVIVLIFRLLSLCGELRWRDSERGMLLKACLIGALLCASIGTNAYRVWREVKDPFPFKVRRAHVEHELSNRDGMHVVFVHYSPDHDVSFEWVYNLADIDGQKIVWARDLGPETNRQLVSYYKARHFWMLNADTDMPEPIEYQP